MISWIKLEIGNIKYRCGFTAYLQIISIWLRKYPNYDGPSHLTHGRKIYSTNTVKMCSMNTFQMFWLVVRHDSFVFVAWRIWKAQFVCQMRKARWNRIKLQKMSSIDHNFPEQRGSIDTLWVRTPIAKHKPSNQSMLLYL